MEYDNHIAIVTVSALETPKLLGRQKFSKQMGNFKMKIWFYSLLQVRIY